MSTPKNSIEKDKLSNSVICWASGTMALKIVLYNKQRSFLKKIKYSFLLCVATQKTIMLKQTYLHADADTNIQRCRKSNDASSNSNSYRMGTKERTHAFGVESSTFPIEELPTV